MNALVSGACVLAFAFSLNAQINAVLKRFPARSPEVGIRNRSTVNLTALAISMAPVAQGGADRAPCVFFGDTAVDTDRLGVQNRLPLPPYQEFAVPVTSGFRAGRPVDLF